MLPLYRIIAPNSKTYYERMMFELSALYDKAGIKDKKKEIDDIIESIETK